MLLVATPDLLDPNFSDTVVLMLEVDGDGALGVVLNRPSPVPVAEVLDPWADACAEPEVLFRGGPVSVEGALAVARLRDPDDAPVGFRVLDDALGGVVGLVDLDTPVELVTESLAGLRIFAGYAGWGAEQLARRSRRAAGTSSRRGPRRLPGRPHRPQARRAAPPARRARLALDAACGSGPELATSGTYGWAQ